LPIVTDFSQVFNHLDIKATISLLGKMAVERAMNGAELNDCREALINAVVDAFRSYNKSVGERPQCLLAPIHGQMKFFPLYALGMLKNVSGPSHAFFQS
jgi:hypothetical protein